MNKRLSQESLRHLLDYDRRTGKFVCLDAPNGRIVVGQVAGSLSQNGYVQIKVNGVLYKAHRLAWLWVLGKWPEKQIDHIDGKRNNNRFVNLRDADRKTNTQNRKRAPRSNKSTGLLGVSRRNDGAGFQARIYLFGKEVRLGTFATAKKAHDAYIKEKRLHHAGCTI